MSPEEIENLFVQVEVKGQPFTSLRESLDHNLMYVTTQKYEAAQSALQTLKNDKPMLYGQALPYLTGQDDNFFNLPDNCQTAIKEALEPHRMAHDINIVQKVYKHCKGEIEQAPEKLMRHPAVKGSIAEKEVKSNALKMSAYIEAVDKMSEENRQSMLETLRKGSSVLKTAPENELSGNLLDSFNKKGLQKPMEIVPIMLERMGLTSILLNRYKADKPKLKSQAQLGAQ